MLLAGQSGAEKRVVVVVGIVGFECIAQLRTSKQVSRQRETHTHTHTGRRNGAEETRGR